MLSLPLLQEAASKGVMLSTLSLTVLQEAVIIGVV